VSATKPFPAVVYCLVELKGFDLKRRKESRENGLNGFILPA
jgi:hypothetical protein